MADFSEKGQILGIKGGMKQSWVLLKSKDSENIQIWACGSNRHSELGFESEANKIFGFTNVPNPSNLDSIYSGQKQTFFTKNNKEIFSTTNMCIPIFTE